MTSENDKLDELQKMLALKRHEQPPTQFFRGLSDNVLQRLQSQEGPPEPTWRQKFGLDFDSKPVLVCATAVGVCGLFLLGLISAQHVDPPSGDPASPEGAAQLSLAPAAFPNVNAARSGQLAPIENPIGHRRSFDPVIVGQGPATKSPGVPAGDTKNSDGSNALRK